MWPILQFPGDLVTFTVETRNEKLQFLQYDDFMTEVSSAELISCHFLFWYQGQIQRFWKSGLYVSHQGWPTKKILGFRWSKKTKITLEAISFWRNISISVFKFSPFLYTMKACRCNIINFSKLTNPLIRKEKKHAYSSQCENKKFVKLDFVLNKLFHKTL